MPSAKIRTGGSGAVNAPSTASASSPVSSGHGKKPALRRLGATCGRHSWRVIAIWLIVLAALFAGSRHLGATYSDNVNLAGTQANTGATMLKASDPSAGGYSGLVVLKSGSGSLASHSAQVDSSIEALGRLPHVESATNPLTSSPPTVSAGGTIGYSTVEFNVQPATLGASYVSRLDTATSAMREAGIQVQYGGGLDQLTRPKAKDITSELFGFAVALIVLLLIFGSVLGAVLPLVTAIISVLAGISILGIAAASLTFGTSAPTLAAMIGIGVGIDYAVFLSTRFRQQMIDGADPAEAAGFCVTTSGRAVLVAAGTVAVAMLGLYASGITFVGLLGLAAVFGVVTAAAGAITLVPACLGLAGRRIDRLRIRRAPVAETGASGDGWHRYAAMIGRRPWLFLLAGLTVLCVLAIPLLSIQAGHVGDGADPLSYTDKQAYDLISDGFGPGYNGPFTIVVDVGHSASADTALASTLQSDLQSTPGVAKAAPLQPTPDGELLVGTVIPATGPQDQATITLYNRLVGSTLPQALKGTGDHGYVTGLQASQTEFDQIVTGRLPLIIGVVIAVAFLLIMTAFRSLLLAVKAALLNLFSIGAAYGVVVAVFQFGWGRGLLGVSENVPVEAYVPMIMFAIVFGLSMDYEVFLLSRVKEAWDRTGNHHESVAGGLASTGRVISCAALIMIAVFLSFVTSTDVVIKQLSVGLAASILIDATIVRLILVPAVMYLFGTASWWLPRWLGKILPRIDVEGAPEPPSAVTAASAVEKTAEPAPGTTPAAVPASTGTNEQGDPS
jgi:putative drug exporter of the RND superfamily